MLKRKLLMTVLPLLTAGVIVGTGFSAWQFNEKDTDVSVSAGVHITEEEYDTTKLKLNYESLVLVLDQGGTGVNASALDKGIYFAATTGSAGTAVTSLTATVDGDNNKGTNYTKVTFTIEIAEDYRNYLVINSEAGDNPNEYTAVVEVSLSGGTTATLTLGKDTTGNNFINYATGKKPTTHVAYGTWKTAVEALGGNAVTITATLS